MRKFELPNGWEYKSLYDLVDIIGGVSYSPSDITTSGVRIIRGGNIQDNIVLLRDDDVYLPSSYKCANNTLRKGDIILVASTGSVDALGRTATVWEDMEDVQIGAFLRILRPKEKKYERFLSATLSGSFYLNYIKTVAKGTSINNISQSHIKNFRIPVPSDDELTKISDLYASLSERINLDREINQNLEAFAEQLYNYWFVQFDFPDVSGRPYKTSGGKMIWNEKLKRDIPEGWEDRPLNAVSEIVNGATPSTEDPGNYGGDIVWITPKDLSNQKSKFTYFGERNITQKGYDSCSTALVGEDTILMSSRAPIGLLSIAKCDLCTNQGFKSIEPKDRDNTPFLYYYIKQHLPQIEKLGSGTTFKEVSRGDMEGFPILIPESTVLKKWTDLVKDVFKKQFSLYSEVVDLTKIRDELLPLLMTGQVIIS